MFTIPWAIWRFTVRKNELSSVRPNDDTRFDLSENGEAVKNFAASWFFFLEMGFRSGKPGKKIFIYPLFYLNLSQSSYVVCVFDRKIPRRGVSRRWKGFSKCVMESIVRDRWSIFPARHRQKISSLSNALNFFYFMQYDIMNEKYNARRQEILL